MTLGVAAHQTGGLAICFGSGQLIAHKFLSAFRAEIYYTGFGRPAVEWFLMVAAMMLPIIAPHLVLLRARIFRSQQTKAILAVIAGYMVVWCLIGVPLYLILIAFRASVALFDAHSIAPLLMYLFAIGWVWMPQRQRALNRCHRPPVLAGPTGQIVQTAGHYGLRLGRDCAVVCLPAMVAPMFAGQPLVMMFIVTHALLAERILQQPHNNRPSWIVAFVCMLGLAIPPV